MPVSRHALGWRPPLCSSLYTRVSLGIFSNHMYACTMAFLPQFRDRFERVWFRRRFFPPLSRGSDRPPPVHSFPYARFPAPMYISSCLRASLAAALLMLLLLGRAWIRVARFVRLCGHEAFLSLCLTPRACGPFSCLVTWHHVCAVTYSSSCHVSLSVTSSRHSLGPYLVFPRTWP